MAEPFLGEIRAFGFNFAPRGWAACEGQLLPISSNSALFSLLGTIYGGDGRSTFALPDLRGRSMLNQGTGPGLNNKRIGERGGVEYINLNEAHLPSHNHGVTVKVADQPGAHHAAFKGALGKQAIEATGGQTIEVYVKNDDATFNEGFILGGVKELNVGQSQSVNNMQPYLVVNYCISLQGLFPPRN